MFQHVTSYINLILFNYARPIHNLPVFLSVQITSSITTSSMYSIKIVFTLLHHHERKQIMKSLKQSVLSQWQTPFSFILLNIPLMSTPVPAPTPDCSPLLGLRMAVTGKREQRTRQELGKMGRELGEMKPAELLQGSEYSQ